MYFLLFLLNFVINIYGLFGILYIIEMLVFIKNYDDTDMPCGE